MILPKDIFSQVVHDGLDISVKGVRWVSLGRNNKVKKCSEFIAEKPIFVGDKIDKEELVTIIKQLVKKENLSKKYVACCFLEKLAYSREYLLPKIPLSEVDEAVGWQLQTIFPLNPEEIYYDWKLLTSDDLNLRVVVVAINKVILDGLREALESSGLTPISFEPSASVLSRIGGDEKKMKIVVEVNQNNVSATVVKEQISLLTATYSYDEQVNGKELLTEIVSIIKSVIKRFVGEEKYSELNIYLAGELASVELTKSIEEKTGIGTEVLNLPVPHPRFHVAYLAALSTVLSPASEKSINLLPTNLKYRYGEEISRLQAGTIITASLLLFLPLIILIIGIWVYLKSQLGMLINESNRIKSPLTRTELNIATIIQKSAKIVALQNVKQIPVDKMELILSLMNNRGKLISLTYDGIKQEFKLYLNEVSREELLTYKEVLVDTKMFVGVDIPLSSFSSAKVAESIVTVKVK